MPTHRSHLVESEATTVLEKSTPGGQAHRSLVADNGGERPRIHDPRSQSIHRRADRTGFDNDERPISATTRSRGIWRCAKPLDVHVEAPELYATMIGARYSYADEAFLLVAGGVVTLNGLMNLFALSKTRMLTDLRDVGLTVRYRGEGEVTILAFGDGVTRVIRSVALPISACVRDIDIAVPSIDASSEFIFIRFSASQASSLVDVTLTVDAPPVRDVSLAIVIVTYDRPDEVERQLARLESLQTSDVDYHVMVVDNARSLRLSRPYARTDVLTAPNWGGAGGFTRGLLAALDAGRFTHVMFMDDDAVCHPEAICRAATLLAFARDPATALCGAMNFMETPSLQYEMGATIGAYGVTPIEQNVDIDSPEAVSRNDAAAAPHYGAWWCFMFPLGSVKALPFPFFVRGDDITFSLQNDFVLQKMPGFLAWHPSFEFKISAATEYLVTRSFLMIPMLADPASFAIEAFIAGLQKQLSVELCGLRYAIAEAICAALEDVLAGPAFWLDIRNTTGRTAQLRARETDLHGRRPSRPAKPIRADRWDGHAWQFLYGLFGRLNLPSAICRRKVAECPAMYPLPQLAFLRKGMIYGSPNGKQIMVCRRDDKQAARIKARAKALIARLELTFDTLRRSYREGAEVLQSDAAWRSRLGMGHDPNEHPSI